MKLRDSICQLSNTLTPDDVAAKTIPPADDANLFCVFQVTWSGRGRVGMRTVSSSCFMHRASCIVQRQLFPGHVWMFPVYWSAWGVRVFLHSHGLVCVHEAQSNRYLVTECFLQSIIIIIIITMLLDVETKAEGAQRGALVELTGIFEREGDRACSVKYSVDHESSLQTVFHFLFFRNAGSFVQGCLSALRSLCHFYTM